MIIHPEVNVLLISNRGNPDLEPLIASLRGMAHMQLSVMPESPEDLSGFDVVVTGHGAQFSGNERTLEDFVKSGGGWFGLVEQKEISLSQIFGAQPGPVGPDAEVRVMFKAREHPLSVRLPESIYVKGPFQPLEPLTDDAEIVLYADWHYQHKPLLICRAAAKGRTACTTLHAYDDPMIQQILCRLIRHLAGKMPLPQSLGIALLGYPSWVGPYHGAGAGMTPGLELQAVCDLNPARLEQASRDFPDIKTYESAIPLTQDSAVDIVFVATAPNTHAQLCLGMLEAGKHVVCEKPLALTSAETDSLTEASQRLKLHLGCHQNRRWDVDYRAIRKALARRAIGDLFYLETFVGGFSHPCGYWHSHAPISGGLAYDWGGHYLDWIVSLIPDPAVSVICTGHKRVWHDVTNRDQERVMVRFEGGQEAEFMHSDIAAIRKPKWYLLGTKGAIIGQWRDLSSYDIDPVLYFHRHDIPATEMPPELIICTRFGEGEISMQTLPQPPRRDYAFHSNLADHLLTGEPIEAPLSQSVRVVKILEAASISAAGGGCEVPIDD